MEKIIVLLGAALIGVDLFQHSRDWRLTNITVKVLPKYTDIIQVSVVNRFSPPYIISIVAGLAVTIIALIVLAILAFRERKTIRPELLHA